MSDGKRVLRVLVTEGSKQKVNITVPLGLAQLARIGGVADRLASEHGLDLDEILRGIKESPDGPIVDVVDEKSGEHIEISVDTVGVSDGDRTAALP
jgi:hypothetical protein